jgi:integrase
LRQANRLSAITVSRLNKPGRYADGGGLYLQISVPAGTKAWLYRYMRDGRARQMGLGPLRDVSLAEARTKAAEARKILLDGTDPIEGRRARRLQGRLAAAQGKTFQECAEDYIRAHESSWRNPIHRKQWRSTLENYVYPVIGPLPVSSVDTALVLKVIEPIWKVKPETAGRIRGRIEAILNAATARKQRQGDNPARWRGHLDQLLPSRRKVKAVRHHPALPYSHAPAFMGELRRREDVSARALEFTVLTAARTNETIGAQWTELDLAAKIWTVPAERMKASREHRVPLSDRALEILNSMPRKGDYVFPGARKNASLSNMALLELLRGLNRDSLTVHGFRSTFRDWAAETTNHPNHVVEMALAHVISDNTEAAYRRGDLFEKRRRLMQDWARYCGKTPSVTKNVVPLHSRLG